MATAKELFSQLQKTAKEISELIGKSKEFPKKDHERFSKLASDINSYSADMDAEPEKETPQKASKEIIPLHASEGSERMHF